MNWLLAFLKTLVPKKSPLPPLSDYECTALKEELERDEGRRPWIYRDTVGKWSGGVGRNLTDKGFGEDEIDLMLANDIREAIKSLDTVFPAWRTTLTKRRKRVLLNLMFNMGLPTFGAGDKGFPKFWKAVKAGRTEWAAQELIASKWYTQVKSRGPRLVKMWREG